MLSVSYKLCNKVGNDLLNKHLHVHTLIVGIGVQKQGSGHQAGKAKVQEGRQGLEEEEEEEEE